MRIFVFIILLLFSGCVGQNCDEIYTISGQVLDGTTGNVYANQPLEISVSKTALVNGGYEILTTGKTDAEGKFNLSYKCSNIEDGKVKIVSDFFIFENLPVNQHINRNFYLSSKGKINLTFESSKNLKETNDTLFIGYTTDKGFKIDTFTSSENIKILNIIVPTPYVNVWWAIGSENFLYDPDRNGFLNPQPKYQKINISGDPIIDEVILEY